MKKTLSVILILALLLAAAHLALANNDTIFPDYYIDRNDFEGYTDITEDFWAYKPIRFYSIRGLFSGYPDGTFRPDNTITRPSYKSRICNTSVQLNRNRPLQYLAHFSWC